MQDPIWKYGVILGAAVVALKGLEYYFFMNFLPDEIYIAIIALLFVGLGIWVGKKLTAKAPEKVPLKPFRRNERVIKSLGISDRELEVLQQLSKGHSNQEIANKLFISVNTVKTHLANIYQKLEVKRRSLAIKKARSLKIIP